MTVRPARLVITGAPASGKTKFFERLRSEAAFADFVFLEEQARRLLIEDPSYRSRWAEFHREIYRRQLAQLQQIGDRAFVSDRGTVDAFAFHPETVSDVNSTIDAEYARYTGVVHLGSAAALGEAFYKTDEVRLESIEDTLFIEERIRDVWCHHPGYRFVDALPDVDTKYARFLDTMKKLAGADDGRHTD